MCEVRLKGEGQKHTREDSIIPICFSVTSYHMYGKILISRLFSRVITVITSPAQKA
jgi:hypothetical protein